MEVEQALLPSQMKAQAILLREFYGFGKNEMVVVLRQLVTESDDLDADSTLIVLNLIRKAQEICRSTKELQNNNGR
jgi:hypothetical protein